MTKLLTLRVAPEELAYCDAEARRLGLTRTAYIRARLFNGLDAHDVPKSTFRSDDLVGLLSVGSGSTNSQVRAALAKSCCR